jgi:hypothetical protein
MDSHYIQQVRYKLQKRLKRLNTADYSNFHWVWLQTWGYLQENEITRGILQDLEQRFPKAGQFVGEAMQGRVKVGNTESDHVAFCHALLKQCASEPNFDYLIKLGRALGGKDVNDGVEAFRVAYVELLFDYIDEQIDDKRLVLVLLKKYKHRCEWFRRAELLAKCRADSQKGEKILAMGLYEYLHDQGLQFHIEPQSASGRIDLISVQSGDDRLIADAKIFNPDGGQNAAYITKGFRQIYDYLRDFNEVFGYLVIFNTSGHDLSIATPHQESAVPFVTHNNRTIFFVVIDISDYEESASKRGKLKAYEITPEQLV